jgi:hypothetical protein
MLLPLHRLPEFGHILIVFFEAAGEAVVSIAVADKIKIVGLGRMHGGFERSAAGIPDGPGREARMSIGVVSGLKPHVSMMQTSGVIPV